MIPRSLPYSSSANNGPQNKYGAALDPKESMCFEMSTLRVTATGPKVGQFQGDYSVKA